MEEINVIDIADVDFNDIEFGQMGCDCGAGPCDACKGC